MRLILPLALAALLIPSGFAQQSASPGVPPPPPAPYYPPVAMAPAPNLQAQLATLTDEPATHGGFTFDRNMLSLAQGVLESQGMDAQRAAIALRAISVDNYRYQRPAFYTPEAMGALIESYHQLGWKHLVNANQTPANTAQPRATATDLWVHFSGSDIDGLTVLTRASRMMNVIQIACDLRPLDLLHLGGHFGIPRVDPDAVMVPAPR